MIANQDHVWKNFFWLAHFFGGMRAWFAQRIKIGAKKELICIIALQHVLDAFLPKVNKNDMAGGTKIYIIQCTTNRTLRIEKSIPRATVPFKWGEKVMMGRFMIVWGNPTAQFQMLFTSGWQSFFSRIYRPKSSHGHRGLLRKNEMSCVCKIKMILCISPKKKCIRNSKKICTIFCFHIQFISLFWNRPKVFVRFGSVNTTEKRRSARRE